MRLDLRDIKSYPGKQLDFSYALDDAPGVGKLKAPLIISGTVKNKAGVMELEGAAEGTLLQVCDRCGEQFERDRKLSLTRVLAYDPQNDENDDVYALSGDSIELDDIFIPELILDMEIKSLCAEDCSGGELSGFFTIEKEG